MICEILIGIAIGLGVLAAIGVGIFIYLLWKCS